MTKNASLEDIVNQLRDIVYELKNINKDYSRLTEKVEKIDKQIAEHHDILTRLTSGFNFFWSRILPNLTWIFLISGAVIEMKHFTH